MKRRKTRCISGISVGSAIAIALMIIGLPCWAQEETDDPVTAIPNDCLAGVRGTPCVTSADCSELDTLATVCVDHTCQIPCEDEEGKRDTQLCSLGESCTLGNTVYGPVYYCQVSSFSMDINMLDSCIVHFLQKLTPDIDEDKRCSIQNSLNLMLDQDGDGYFSIFDVDLCIRAFLETEPCDPVTRTCSNNQRYCDPDDESNAYCGSGLYCNKRLRRCERECGLIAAREVGKSQVIDRKCTGSLQKCNYERGRCEAVENVSDITCQVDNDCPTGAFCFLGKCQKKCYRALDCPDSNWYCSPGNTCMPKPGVGDDEELPPNTKEYSVGFGVDDIRLTPIDDSYSIPLVVMSLKSKKQVFDDKRLSFGYRLEASYHRKQTQACLRPESEMTPEEILACEVSPEEEFVILGNPFGVVYATGNPSVDIELNHNAIQRLDPGLYEMEIKAIFSNGSGGSTKISFEKTTPSGAYQGQLSVYADLEMTSDGQIKNLLGNTNMTVELYQTNEEMEWDALLNEYGLGGAINYVDVTQGFVIKGYINGQDSLMFNWPKAGVSEDDGKAPPKNKIPFVGLYSPHLGRMRWIAVVDVPEDYCRSEAGKCSDDPNELQVTNIFGRRVRRLMEFIGPYDETERVFHGIYRETYSGLMPEDVTLSGGFRLRQIAPNEAAIEVPKPLVDAGLENVPFVSTASLQEEVEQEICEACEGTTGVPFCNGDLGSCTGSPVCHFMDQEKYDEYLAQFDHGGRIFSDLTTMGTKVEEFINNLEANNKDGKYLIVNDYLRDNVQFCTSPGQQECIDENKARCGMALYQRALLSKWWNVADLACTGAEKKACHDLFCSVEAGEGCTVTAAENPSLVTMQEHSRFYKEIWQTLAYEAGNELADAFFLLYRGPGLFGQNSAYSYKQDRLYAAWNKYTRIQEQIFSSRSTRILYDWPMRQFKGMGNEWIHLMHSVMTDRMSALEQIIDLKRRIFRNADEGQHDFIHHLAHQEYLAQVFLMLLQRKWEGVDFAYTGNAEEILEQGQHILARASVLRNPLGFHPNRIYFGNSNLQVANWKNYKDRIMNPEHGYLYSAEQAVAGAVTQMKASLTSKGLFESQVLVETHQLEAALDQLCGSEIPLPPECRPSTEEKELALGCQGENCRYQYQCISDVGDECSQVAKAFTLDTGATEIEKTACRLDTEVHTISIMGNDRLCVRGQMGQLSQEMVVLDLKRKQAYERVQALIQRIARRQEYIQNTQDLNKGLIDELKKSNAKLSTIEKVLTYAEEAYQMASNAARGSNCWVIVGMSNGSDCLGQIGEKIGTSIALFTKFDVMIPAQFMKSDELRARDIKLREFAQNEQIRSMMSELDEMAANVENIIHDYQLLTQQLFNLDMRIKDTLYVAQKTADRWAESMKDKVDRLLERILGGEAGNTLRRNRFIQEADRAFLRLLEETYKMAQAFIHRYNMRQDAEQIANRVYQLMTPSEVRDFVNELTRFENEYCENEGGLDCDWVHNPNVVKVSLQKLMFPSLRDIQQDGKVLTVGEQFHNLITSSKYIVRKKRAGGMRDQIELPFSITISDSSGENGKGQDYFISSDECNHLIVTTEGASSNGTIAINVVGARLKKDLYYELYRGETDYIRACDPQQVVIDGFIKTIYPINTYTVGYSPDSAAGQFDIPPTFYTRSQELRACKNDRHLEDSHYNQSDCFRYFARDRSLGAPRWKLIIPRIDSVNSWIFGKEQGAELPEDLKPIIADIEVYIRTSGRPITALE